MNTLKSIAALHLETLNGGDRSKDSQSSYQVIIPRIRHILNDFIKPMMIERYNDDDKTPPSNFVVSYELTVQNDSLGAYVSLAENYISLPHNKGVRRVALRIPSESQPGTYADTECIPTQFPQINQNTRAGKYPTHKKYDLEGNKIRFQNIYAEPGTTTIAVVQIYCAAPDSFGENDSLPLSPDMISQVLLKLNAFISPIPFDIKNDGAPINTLTK